MTHREELPPVQLWYADAMGGTVDQVNAYPRQADYYWVQHKGVLCAKGDQVFDTRPEAVAAVRSEVQRHLSKWREIESKVAKL